MSVDGHLCGFHAALAIVSKAFGEYNGVSVFLNLCFCFPQKDTPSVTPASYGMF